MKNDEYGDRMKGYEAVTRTVLPRRTFTIIRVDGRAFHSYLRHAEKPFDGNVIGAMQRTAQALCAEMSGARFAYTQSDEISVLLTDLDPKSQPWFGGQVQKIASLSASIATAAFNGAYRRPSHPYPFAENEMSPQKLAHFDARVYTIPDRTEVMNYFLWRQQDAIRNAVSMAGHAHFSSKSLIGVSTAEIQERLFEEKGINFKSEYSDEARRGSLISKRAFARTSLIPVRKLRKDRAEEAEKKPDVRVEWVTTLRTEWRAESSPDFRVWEGSDLSDLVPYNGSGPEQKALVYRLGYPIGRALLDTGTQLNGPLYAAESIREGFEDGDLWRAWMIGMNTLLGDESPVEELLKGNVTGVMAAYRAYQDGDSTS